MNNRAYFVVITTTDEESDAEGIASHLVKSKLAACVQIDKIRSYYNWEAELQIGNEYRLFIKAPKDNYAAIEKAILQMHNYSLPQIVKLEITGGFDSYLRWLDDSCKK